MHVRAHTHTHTHFLSRPYSLHFESCCHGANKHLPEHNCMQSTRVCIVLKNSKKDISFGIAATIKSSFYWIYYNHLSSSNFTYAQIIKYIQGSERNLCKIITKTFFKILMVVQSLQPLESYNFFHFILLVGRQF